MVSVQEKPWGKRRGRQGQLLSWILLVVLGAVVSGCGGSSSEDTTTAKARPLAPCQLGRAVAPHVPEPPSAWTSGPRPAIALTCSNDRVDPGAAIVAYPLPGGGSCVSAYSPALGGEFGELCEPTGSRWTSQCEGRGCVHYFRHTSKSTVVAGPVPAELEGVWVAIGGKQVLDGVMLTTPHGRWLGRIGAKVPFGYFAAYIPRCVEPDQVSVHMVAADGTQLGEADKWDVSESKCPGS